MLAKFTNEQTARNFSDRTAIRSAIILGDDNRYWVVTMAKMEELVKAGYEAI